MNFIFPKEDFVPISDDEYWQIEKKRGEILEPLSRPCGDCAIVTGFYLELAESLKLQSIDVQKEVASRWFCHNKCDRACAGIKEFINQD